jgi:dienelactone hydrolase
LQVEQRSYRLPASAILALVLLFSPLSVWADSTGSSLVAPTAPMNERVVELPGDPDRPVTLQVTILTPDGPGPFPLAVMNHGSNGKVRPSDAPRYHQTFSAYYFLSRGYAVVLPMMRGYAGSGGHIEKHGCDLASTSIDSAKDIRAVIQYMSHQPGIDGSRIVVGGQSFGGWNTLATGTLGIPGVRALVDFAGGVIASDCPNTQSSLADGAARFGGRTTVPSIWFYGDNDKLFAPAIWRAMYGRYTAAGGKAELVAYGTFGEDAHQMLSSGEGLHIWAPKVDAFLTRAGLPGKLLYPAYVPTEAPPPTGYAASDDAESVPYVGDSGKALYQHFSSAVLPRAFVVAPNGIAASAAGGFDPIAKALADCLQHAPHCELYAVDNDVVWTPPHAPRPTRFAAPSDAAAVPYVPASGHEGYKKFLTLRKPRAFVIAPDGGWFFASRGPDPLTAALDGCSKLHKSCGLYAVDDDVVWGGK